MSIEIITARIRQDAEAEAGRIRAEARAQAEQAAEAARAEAEQILQEARKRAETEKSKVISQKQAVADIDTRMLILLEKQAAMDRCFELAKTKILGMDRGDYFKFLAGIAADSGLTSGEIILSGQDLPDAEKILAAVQEALPGSRFTAAQKPGDFAGGLIVHQDKMFVNGTVENFLEEARKSMTREVADELFPQERQE